MDLYFKIRLYEKLISYAIILGIIVICFIGTVLFKIFTHHQERQNKLSDEFWKQQEEQDGEEQ